MIYSQEVEEMCTVAQGVHHGAAPIPEEAKWVKSKEIKDISGLTHGVGWCAPQQGACKLTLNVKEGIIQEALVETIGCSGMTHSAAMASEILPGLTVLEALNTDLVCDAINTAMRELFLQIVYGRTQSAFSEEGLPVGAGLEDLGKGLRSQVGTMYGTLKKGPRYLEMAEGYVTGIALVETIGCSGMTHSAAMASEILPGLTVLEALNTDLVCDAINTAMRELFLQIVYGRTQSAFSEEGLPVGAGLEDLGKGLRSQVGTMYGTLKKGPRYLEMAEGYVTGIALDADDQIIGYQYVSLGKMTDFIKKGDDPNTAWEKAKGQYGRVDDAVKIIDPRKE